MKWSELEFSDEGRYRAFIVRRKNVTGGDSDNLGAHRPSWTKLPTIPYCGRLGDLATDRNKKKHKGPNACYDSRPSDG